MSDWTPRAGPHAAGAELGETAAERAAREERHQVIIELLGAYADGELPPETRSQIDAHLVGCARCRRDLAVHQTVRRRLGLEPPLAAPPALRERIAAAVAATPVTVTPPPASRPTRLWRVPARPAYRFLALILIALSALAAAAVWIGVAPDERADSPALGQLASSPASVPLIRGVLADYRRVTASDLPGRARDLEVVRGAVPFPVEPLRASGVRLLAVWTTELEGEPAAVLAYRWDDRIVLQYLLPEIRFFQHRDVRRAVTDGRLLVAADGAQGIVAWPTEAAGALLVGDLKPERLARLAAADLLVRRVDRGAQ
jgi:anti-sigma factor RsiW